MIGKKGQTAFEGAFIILFITMAVFTIMQDVLTYSSDIEEMSKTRMAAQAAALDLTLQGTTTHLVRVDYNQTTTGLLEPMVWVISENCTQVKTKETFQNALSAAGIKNADWACGEDIYGHVPITPGGAGDLLPP
jgi:hypothetical protein